MDEEHMRYFDPSHDASAKARLGKAFHLSIDYDSFLTPQDQEHQFVRDISMDQVVQDMTMEEIFGYIPSTMTFDTSAYAVRAVCFAFATKIYKTCNPILLFGLWRSSRRL
jgi:hypothetical protein